MKDRVVNHVKAHRTQLGLTQEQLAKAVGVSRQTVISIERGRYTPSLPLALRLASAFACPMDDLFQREEVT
jgi:putative transcriptional regulator